MNVVILQYRRLFTFLIINCKTGRSRLKGLVDHPARKVGNFFFNIDPGTAALQNPQGLLVVHHHTENFEQVIGRCTDFPDIVRFKYLKLWSFQDPPCYALFYLIGHRHTQTNTDSTTLIWPQKGTKSTKMKFQGS